MQPVQALLYLTDTVIQIFSLLILLRVLLQLIRADYYNALVQIIVRFTDPVLKPARKLIPSIGRLDMAGVVCFIGLQALALLLRLVANQAELPWGAILFLAIQRSIQTLLMTYLILIIANVLISLFGQRARHPIIPLIYQLTEPVLGRIRRVIPAIAGLDLSPLVAIIGIQFLMILIGWR